MIDDSDEIKAKQNTPWMILSSSLLPYSSLTVVHDEQLHNYLYCNN